MKSGTALLWKEWREIRWFLVAGAAIFIGWPLLEAVGNYLHSHKFYSADMPEAMALLLGGPFAILVAVGVTCRDLKEDITCFWQSRPVSIRRWAATKYLTGLAVVLMMLCVPLVMKILVMRAEHELGQLSSILICHTFTVILIYSISFLAGCLIRAPVYAVIFSGASALLVYFLPILTPPLESFSVFNIMIQSPVVVVQLSKSAQGEPWIAEKMRVVKIPWADDLALCYNIDLLRYIAFALAGSFAAVVLSGIAVKRNWRLKVGQKLMFCLLGGVGMLLFLTVVFQLRSNLECVRQIPITTAGVVPGVVAIASDGDKGVLLLHSRKPGYAADEAMYYSLMTFDLSAKESFGEEIVIPQDLKSTVWWLDIRGKLVWSAKRPQWTYLIKTSWSKNETDGKNRVDKVELLTISLTKGDVMTVVDKLDLLPYLGDRTTLWGSLYMLNSTIYVSTLDKLLIFDVGSDGKPVLRKVIKGQFGIHDGIGRVTREQLRESMLFMRLVPVEGLNTEERLKITVELATYHLMASEGDIIIGMDYDSPLTVYRLKEVRGDIATLEMAGYHRPTPLERFMGPYPMHVFVRDGLAYVVGLGLGGLSVYDVRRPQQIRRIGHYAAPKEWLQAIAPLPDGNILVGGNKLYIVAPPRTARAPKTVRR